MVRKTVFLVVSLLFGISSYAQELTRGEILFQKCVGCHGQDGKNKAFGKSSIIAGQPAEDLIESLTFYKESEFKAHTSTTVMAKQVKAMANTDIIDVATYVSKLPK
ncbi:MAG: c-type cytochrome [Sulfurospirillaceae bacterium]|jgi:cytochrome c553|nr:c-type cytochrome [Sulfurospirillaceae bacterium]MDD2825433.1 c-type cytochrome [Sulfurospirillaceae bacterium]